MIRKIINYLQAWKHRWIVCRDPYEKINDYGDSAAMIRRNIDEAMYHHHIVIVETEIDMFISAFSGEGFDDFDQVVDGLRRYLSERIDELQLMIV